MPELRYNEENIQINNKGDKVQGEGGQPEYQHTVSENGKRLGTITHKPWNIEDTDGEEVCYLDIEPSALEGTDISILKYAIIPLVKREGQKEENKQQESEDTQSCKSFVSERAPFCIRRRSGQELYDYVTWPIMARKQGTWKNGETNLLHIWPRIKTKILHRNCNFFQILNSNSN